MRDNFLTKPRWHGVVASLLVGSVLAGCEVLEPNRATVSDLRATVVYHAPSAPSAVKEGVADQPVDAVQQTLLARFQTGELEVSSVNPDESSLVLIYRGAPEQYVDCGWMAVASGGPDTPATRVEGAQARTRVPDLDGRPGGVVDRDMQLLSRVLVQLKALDPQFRTLITTDATYVLTKTLTRQGADGQPEQQSRETITFTTGNADTFSNGTACRTTGRIEALVLAAASGAPIDMASSEPAAAAVGAAATGLADGAVGATAVAEPLLPAPDSVDVPVVAVVAPVPPPDPAEIERSVDAVVGSVSCADIQRTVGPDGSVVLFGFVETQGASDQIAAELRDLPGVASVDNQLAVQPWPYCEVLTTVAPYQSASSLMGLSVFEHRNGEVSGGEDLVLLLESVPAGSHILISYFRQNDEVVHIGPIRPENLLPVGLSTFKLNTNFTIAPPYGREMAIAVVTRQELFTEPRSRIESAEDYLPDLQEHLRELRGQGGREVPTVLPLFLETRPSGTT